ncbi:MAG: endolytic transglycosylase MltG [Gammaproteobacteria bacterium]|nr:endolytic transglycosylase MltG [Gammaproteobacteria bacterium]
MLGRIFGIVILGASFLMAWFWMAYNEFSQSPLNLPDSGLIYTLEPGTSTAGVATALVKQGALDNALYFRLLARVEGKAGNLKAGEYNIPVGTTPSQLLILFVEGKVTNYSLTLVEGWSFKQMLEAVKNSSSLDKQLDYTDSSSVMEQIGYSNEHPEGRFLADTYHFPKGTVDVAFLQRAYRSMQKLLQKEWENRAPNLPLKSSYEALILASIIEKETAVAEERPAIAGVFIRRLRMGMKLQTDPTVIYGMGERYNGNIRRKDLREDTPYNTYVHRGLPPTPIAMPGKAALRAALHPEKGNSLYFVAKGDGSHYFSATLKEHNNAVQKYQLKR